MDSDFYTEFENNFRGSREQIINVLSNYDDWYNILNVLNQETVNIKYFSRFPKIDKSRKKTLDEFKLSSIRDLEEYCLTKTYQQLLKTAIEKKYSSILIIQDTSNFHKNSIYLFKKFIKDLPNDWDLFYLGAENPEISRISLNTRFYKANKKISKFYGVALNKKTIVSLYKSLINNTVSINEILNSKHELLNCFVCFPNIMISPQTTNRSVNSLGWDLEQYILPEVSNSDPLVSVIMTSFNSEKYISFSIESILQQTYSNFELIIIDDNSSDDTVDIIKKYKMIDSRIVLIENEKNYGTYVSKNIGMKKSRGQYITFQDSDDYSMLDRLEFCLGSLQKSNNMVCYGMYLSKNNEMTYCEITMFMRRDCLDYIGYFDSVRFGADTEYRLRLTTMNVPILYIKKYIYTRLDRLMEGNGIGNKNSLTNNSLTHINSNIRFIYKNSFQCYHKLLKTKKALKEKKYYIDFPLDSRPFTIMYNNQVKKNILEVELTYLDKYLYKVKL